MGNEITRCRHVCKSQNVAHLLVLVPFLMVPELFSAVSVLDALSEAVEGLQALPDPGWLDPGDWHPKGSGSECFAPGVCGLGCLNTGGFDTGG